MANGSKANGLKDDVIDKNYTLIPEGDSCYAIVDLQKSYALTKVVVNAINGNYRFEVYGSADGTEYVKLGENEAVASYIASEGFTVAVSGNYRYVKIVGTVCQYGYFTIYEIDVYGSELPEIDEPDAPTEEPVEEIELSNQEGVTVTVGGGLYTGNINNGQTSGGYTLVLRGPCASSSAHLLLQS